MAQATNTQLGEIQLAGDLAGNGGPQVGTNPQLKTMPGLVAGQYVLPRMTVDSKGRITAIENGAADIIDMIPSASATNAGLVSIGENIFTTDADGAPGFWTVGFGGTLVAGAASGLANQACATYSFDVVVDHGPVQTIEVAGSDVQTIALLVAEINSKLIGAVCGVIGGNFIITSVTEGNNSSVVLSNISLFACIPGYVNDGSGTVGFGACEIYVKRGSDTEYGVVKIGNGIEVQDGVISVTSTSIPIATGTTLGGVSVPPSGNLVISAEGAVSVPLATASVPGVIKVGSGLTVSSGVLTPALVNATTSVKGVVQVGTNINVAAGVISVPQATSSTLGVARVGTGLVATAGVISVAPATASTLGGIKAGSGITITGDGTISAAVVPDATTGVKGVVQIGSGISVSAGAISVATATAVVKGVVQIGTGLSVSAGTITPVVATNTTKGIVTTASTTRLTITAGAIDIVADALPLLASRNTFTKAQITAMYNLGTGTTVTPDLTNSNVFKWAPTAASFTIGTPTNAVAGGIYTFNITTPAGATTLTLPSTFKFSNGVKPVPSAGKYDVLTCVFDGTNYLCNYLRGAQ